MAATSTSAALPGTRKRVAGLVTIDSYHDDPEDLRAEGFVWTDNPEFVDYVDYSEELDTLTMPIGDFPVLDRQRHRSGPRGREEPALLAAAVPALPAGRDRGAARPAGGRNLCRSSPRS